MSADEALRELTGAGDEDLPRLLLRAFRATNEAVVERMLSLGHGGVRAAHAAVFTNLDAAGTRVVDLAARAQMTRQGMSALVRDLVDAGYLEVSPDPHDGRAGLVRLTEQGIAFCHQAAEAVRDLERQWEDLLGAPALAQVRRALHLLAAHPPRTG